MPTRASRATGNRRKVPPPVPASDWAYFLDIDGTLLDLAPSPSLARSDIELHSLVDDLYDFAGGAVALISGRQINAIDSFFPRTRLPVAGQHGLEHRDARGRIHRHHLPSDPLRHAFETITRATERHPKLLLENKGLSLALHYRAAPRLGSFAHRLVRSVQERLGPEYAVQPGKYLVELKPSARNKGNAVLEFMSEPPFRGRTPVFLGDDVTDEYAFDVVNELDGHSIKVGSGRTSARHRLPDVRAVRAWLRSGMRRGAEPGPRAARR